MPEIEKDLQYFKEEVAKEHNYNSFEHLSRLTIISTPKYFYDLSTTALGRFHAYQIEQLKEQLAQNDKETESLKKLALNWASTAEEQKATIERLTKELRETKEQLNSAEEYINTHG